MTSKEELSKKYQKKSDKQHVLDNPDTYIGSIENIECDAYIYDEDTKKIIQKQIIYNPGLYKLFDEGIVNCRDHFIRMQQLIVSSNDEDKDKNYPVTKIDISIDETGIITLTNDGNGIDVSVHPEYNIWIPELIFGHLRTSTNYDKDEKKIVGGKNGFGFKLVLIWSSWGKIETVDAKTGQKYVQEFKDNLNIIEKPQITKCKNKPYTSVSFKPDYKRLKIDGLSPDFIALLKRRVYDIAAITHKSIKVKYNANTIEVKTFMNYIDLYIGSKSEKERIYE
jgi:DNA topoisomerase-2